jgi:hypothetical protein
VDDQPYRRRQLLGDAIIAEEPVLGLVPVIDQIGQPLVVDDDEDVVIRIIAANRIGDPVAARIASVEDDLENAALLLPLLRRKRSRVLELGEEDFDDAREVLLLAARKMV